MILSGCAGVAQCHGQPGIEGFKGLAAIPLGVLDASLRLAPVVLLLVLLSSVMRYTRHTYRLRRVPDRARVRVVRLGRVMA